MFVAGAEFICLGSPVGAAATPAPGTGGGAKDARTSPVVCAMPPCVVRLMAAPAVPPNPPSPGTLGCISDDAPGRYPTGSAYMTESA